MRIFSASLIEPHSQFYLVIVLPTVLCSSHFIQISHEILAMSRKKPAAYFRKGNLMQEKIFSFRHDVSDFSHLCVYPYKRVKTPFVVFSRISALKDAHCLFRTTNIAGSALKKTVSLAVSDLEMLVFSDEAYSSPSVISIQ